ncbi:ATP-binding protein [Nonomuraea sp. NPDC050556]|uniref:ATP-binding protein n=1 Tax=Nonomuraea sp. NPDC050556 TaxID=3364369 RepID=UPI003787A53E
MVSQTGLQELGVVELTRDDRAPYRAREHVTSWVGSSHPAREMLILATSELVTNAVTHADLGHGRCWVLVQLARGVDFFRLAVTDPGSVFSQPYRIPLQAPRLGRNAETGRGLGIVASLSRGRWGTYVLPQTAQRVVWCHLDAVELLLPEAQERTDHRLKPA